MLRSDSSASSPPIRSGITWRSVVLGLALAGVLCAVEPYNDWVLANTFLAGNHFPIGPVAALLILSSLNLLADRLRGRSLLTPRELAVVYIILTVAVGIPSSGLLRYVLTVAATPYYFAGHANQWGTLILDRLPTGLVVGDGNASTWFWEGLPTGAPLPWRAWSAVLARWFILAGAVWAMFFCLAVLIRKQWVEHDRLTFPLVQFPFEVLRDTEERRGGFFSNHLVWIGAGSVFLLHLANGLHQYFPALPEIPRFFLLDQYLGERPLSGALPVRVRIYPAILGFGYLLPLEITAGFWGSILLVKAQGIAMSSLGYEGDSLGGTIHRVVEQEQMGGLLVMAGVLLWFLRGTLLSAFKSAFMRRAVCPSDDREPLSYRAALLGFLLSAGVALIWLTRAGMTWPVAALDLVIFLSISLVLTRIVAEGGIMHVQLSYAPTSYLLMLGGTAALGPANLTALTIVETSLVGRDLRESLMPYVLNNFRLGELAGVSSRRLIPLMSVAVILALAVGTPAFLTAIYARGGAQVAEPSELWYGPRLGFDTLAARLQNPATSSPLEFVATVVGAASVAVLIWLRLRFTWWPIHPLGFVMATSWPIMCMWFSLFAAWILKYFTIRYSGLRGYRRARPFFLGLVMGDVLSATLWIIVGFFTSTGYRVMLE